MADFFSVTSAGLPLTGKPGDVYYTTDTRKVYIVFLSGVIAPILGYVQPLTDDIPISIKGETGPPGPPGPQGPPGPPGPPGFLPNPIDVGTF